MKFSRAINGIKEEEADFLNALPELDAKMFLLQLLIDANKQHLEHFKNSEKLKRELDASVYSEEKSNEQRRMVEELIELKGWHPCSYTRPGGDGWMSIEGSAENPRDIVSFFVGTKEEYDEYMELLQSLKNKEKKK